MLTSQLETHMEKFEMEKRVCENGDQRDKEFREKKKQLGGVRTMPFILANEICDRFAGAGFHANMITYLTQVLNLPNVKASNILSNFAGTSNLTPLVGAFLADSIAGRFWTIIIASIFYLMGMIAITASSILPHLRPPPCPTQTGCREASSGQMWVLYAALFLTSLGTGGLRPCVVTFAADQFDMARQKTEPDSWNFFNWYYFCMAMASLLALTIVVYIQDNISWAWGLGIPTIAMALSLVAFITGSTLYRKIRLGGSPFTRVAQVVVAAFRKRKVDIPADPRLLYNNRKLDADISVDGMLLHSDQFKCLDHAAVLSSPSDMKAPGRPNPWRLATVHRVEELKTIIRLFPIWSAAILLAASHAHLSSFTIQQARTMDRHLSPSFQIPPASMSTFSTLTTLAALPLYDRLLLPLARRLTANPSGITSLQRMGIGYAISILASIVSGLVEVRRKRAAAEYGLLNRPAAIIPVSVFWLVPQYSLHGLAEVFMAVGHMEFLYDQSPESMRSTSAALYWIAIAVGNYLSTGMVSLVHGCTGSKGNWLPDRNLNRGRLENYYWLVAGVQVVNLGYYVACAWYYTYKPIGEATESEEVEYGDEDGKVRC